jgi:hypothetical protein
MTVPKSFSGLPLSGDDGVETLAGARSSTTGGSTTGVRRCSRGRSTKRHRATTPCGCTASDSESSAASSTSVQAGAAARRSAYVVVAAGVANTSTTQPGTESAPSTAFGPSARNSRCSARNARRASFRAVLTRPLVLISGTPSGVRSARELATSCD